MGDVDKNIKHKLGTFKRRKYKIADFYNFPWFFLYCKDSLLFPLLSACFPTPPPVCRSVVCIHSDVFTSCKCRHVSLCRAEREHARVCLMTPVAMETASCFRGSLERGREWLLGSLGGSGLTVSVWVCTGHLMRAEWNIKTNVVYVSDTDLLLLCLIYYFLPFFFPGAITAV